MPLKVRSICKFPPQLDVDNAKLTCKQKGDPTGIKKNKNKTRESFLRDVVRIFHGTRGTKTKINLLAKKRSMKPQLPKCLMWSAGPCTAPAEQRPGETQPDAADNETEPSSTSPQMSQTAVCTQYPTYFSFWVQI